MNRLFTSGGQSIGASASASVLPANIQGGCPLVLNGLISLQSKDSQESFPAPQVKGISSSVLSLFYCPALTSIHDYWKSHSFDYTDLVGKVIYFLICCLGLPLLFFQEASVFIISCLQSPCTVILEPEKIKSVTVSIVSPSICHEVMAPDAIILVF